VTEPRPAENEGARVASSTPPQPKNREAVKNVITQYLTVNAENPYWPIDEMSSELTDVVMAVLPADPPPPATMFGLDSGEVWDALTKLDKAEARVARLTAALAALSYATGAYIECDERPRPPALWTAMCEAQSTVAVLLNEAAP
jgi:hypothetical protein